MSEIIYKQAPINLEGGEKGHLLGFANLYNDKDLQGDISGIGSFIKTVNERKAKMKIYRNHDPDQFAGVPFELDPNNPKGLFVNAKMIMDTQIGRDTYTESKFLVDNGFESGFSIGGYVMKRDKENKSIVTEYKLSEISVLTMEQANVQSMVSMVKSFQENKELKEEEFWNAILKAYDHNFSDNILKSLETFLTLKEKPSIDTSKVEPSRIITNIYSQFIKQ